MIRLVNGIHQGERMDNEVINKSENSKHMDSEFARLHPLVNFIYIAGVITITMLSNHPILLCISLVASFVYSVMLCGINIVKKDLLFYIPVIAFTVLIQPLFSHNGITALFYLNNNAVTLESVIYGIAVSILLISTIQWFNCYQVLITSDKFLYLFGKIIPSLALVISMIFRMIPLLRHRFTEIDEAQAGMGKKPKGMRLFSRIRIFIKELSILTAWSLEASIDTSDSMESRGYGIKGRTSFHLFKWKKVDYAWLIAEVLIISICIKGIVEKSVQIYYFPVFQIKQVSTMEIIIFVNFIILAISPIIYDLGGRVKWQRLNSKM